jgi:hypothetical protein
VTTCWLHPDVVMRASPIAGVGLFATTPIAAGQAVSIVGGEVVRTARLRELIATSPSYVDTIVIGPDEHLVLPPGTPNGKGNHSCDPNVWWTDAVRLSARRDIAAGEEITNDYATSTGEAGFTMLCSCGSPLCRSIVTGADWRRPELRERYGEHWVLALLARIGASSSAGTAGQA